MREQIRQIILDLFGIDIDKYKFEFKSSLNAYTINVGEYTIRITIADDVNKETSLARMNWARDLKEFKNTICEPIPSKNGELIEELTIGKWNLFISLFRTARGQLISPDDIRPMVLISAGDMLGTMHHFSMLRDSSESMYEIPQPEEVYESKRRKIASEMDAALRARIDDIIIESSSREKTLENYGICYGEFDLHNIIVDTNNIHLFDFDGTIYAHYLYDVASFLVSILSAGYQPGRPSRDITFKTFIPWFRIGYSINKHCEEHTFDDIELYMELRGVWLLINLMEKYLNEERDEIKAQIDFVSEILMGKDIFEGIDRVRKILFR